MFTVSTETPASTCATLTVNHIETRPHTSQRRWGTSGTESENTKTFYILRARKKPPTTSVPKLNSEVVMLTYSSSFHGSDPGNRTVTRRPARTSRWHKKASPAAVVPSKSQTIRGFMDQLWHRSAMIGPTGVRGKHSASCRLLFVLRCARMAPMEGDSNSSLWGLNVSWKLCVCVWGGGGGNLHDWKVRDLSLALSVCLPPPPPPPRLPPGLCLLDC